MTTEPHPFVQPAKAELAALAAKMRPDWDVTVLDDALMAAAHAGWSWEKTAKHVWLLIWRADSEPRELRDAARRPIKPQDDAAEGPAAEYMEAKASMLERLAKRGPAVHQTKLDDAAASDRDVA
jgi:hypothetical protein